MLDTKGKFHEKQQKNTLFFGKIKLPNKINQGKDVFHAYRTKFLGF